MSVCWLNEMDASVCHICGNDGLVRIEEYERLRRVTSDCKPWPPEGRLAVCRSCGCAQAITDTVWQEQAVQIYQNYTIYHQAQGAEQSVFDQSSGQPAARSDRLLQRFQKELPLSEQGRLLDIGCGNGAMLRAFSRRWPKWRLAGVEVNDRYKADVERIPGVEQLYTGSPQDVPGRFDMISLVHVLEHIAGPKTFIEGLHEKLESGGRILVQVPDCQQNPFMLAVADHATHFFRDRLSAVVAQAGYSVAAEADDWIPKEISVVGQIGSGGGRQSGWPELQDAIAPVRHRVRWLNAIVDLCRCLRAQGEFGIFGTSIAATWLFSELNGNVDFFIDEDPHRISQTHLGRSILAPSAAPPKSHVFLALPGFLARAVAARLAQQSLAQFHLPPE